MKGIIRAKGKCPRCNKPFTDVSRGISMHKNLGIICVSCRNIPERFYLDLHHQGKRIRIFSDRQGNPLDRYQKAAALLNEINNEISHGQSDLSAYCRKETEKTYLVSELLDVFLARKAGSVAPSYRRHYRRYGEIVRDFFRGMDLRDIRESHLQEFRKHLEGQFSFSGKTLKNVFDYLKTFLYFFRNELNPHYALPVFPDIAVARHHHTWISREDQRTLLEKISDSDRPILAFLMLHGCRPSEARGLKCRDIDLQTGTIMISGAFSGNEYRSRLEKRARLMTIPVHPEMLDFLSVRVKNDQPDAYVFINQRTGKHYSASALDRAWFQARNLTGLKKGVRLYDVTRHSFLSQLISSGAPAFSIARLLGHPYDQTIRRYDKSGLDSLKTEIKTYE